MGVNPTRRYKTLVALVSPLLIAAQSPLIMTKPGQDLSAYRFDGDVFGWNRSFTEVAAVGTEVRRGPEGKHRGEAYLLVYKVGETTPTYNVITHTVTHADLPHDPIPLDDARDLMWVIENSYLEMWPVRPKRHYPAGAMKVEPLWDAMESDSRGPCTPGVAFLLDYHGQKRLQPYQAVDMQANCSLIKLTDKRVYWGKKDVAAAMVRFDFSPRPDNEESARFVVSAAWSLGQSLRMRVDIAGPMAPDARAQVNTTVRQYGVVNFRTLTAETQDAADLDRITAKSQWLPLARRLARELHAPSAFVVVDDSAPMDLVLHYGAALPPPVVTAPTPAASTAPKPVLPDTRRKIPLPYRPGDPILPAEGGEVVEDPTLQQNAQPNDTHAAPAAPSAPNYVKDWSVH